MNLIDLRSDTVCDACGVDVREHSTGCRCRLYFKPCVEVMRRWYSDLWETYAPYPDGRCLLCGEPFMEHWTYREFRVTVLGKAIERRSEIAFLMPAEFHDCPITED